MRISGKQAKKVTILKKSVTHDDYNQEVETWAADTSQFANGKIYMEWWDQGGKEALESGQIVAVQDVRVKTREYIDGLTQQTQHQYRLQKDGVEYDIENVKEVNRNEAQILMISARDNE